MERVVITGLGMVTPVGVGTDESWKSLIAGQSGIGPITLFPVTGDYPTRIAGEVKDFDPTLYMEKKKLKEVARFIPFSLATAHMALAQSGLELTEELKEKAGVYIGVGLGGLENLEECAITLHEKGPKRVSPYFIPSLIANMAAGQVSIRYGLRGPSFCHTSACASSSHALGEAFRLIQYGKTPVMIAGGAEATITRVAIGGFGAMFALSRRNDEPQRACRPWDKGRDGFVCGEGGATFVLESLSHARARGAKILAEIVGYGATCDAYHITKTAPDGCGAVQAMKLALADASLSPDQIDYINAHGTSTPVGDVSESKAIVSVFGEHATSQKLWVSSTKSMMGHLLGAAGAAEAGVCVQALQTGLVPPTINLEDKDPEVAIDCVPNVARERKLHHVLSNSFGFGGTNGCLAFSAFEG
jgi:3-oxoacyl-[acyl-carrier-protein] synthase II